MTHVANPRLASCASVRRPLPISREIGTLARPARSNNSRAAEQHAQSTCKPQHEQSYSLPLPPSTVSSKQAGIRFPSIHCVRHHRRHGRGAPVLLPLRTGLKPLVCPARPCPRGTTRWRVRNAAVEWTAKSTWRVRSAASRRTRPRPPATSRPAPHIQALAARGSRITRQAGSCGARIVATYTY